MVEPGRNYDNSKRETAFGHGDAESDPEHSRKIIHIDMDAFFASVEFRKDIACAPIESNARVGRQHAAGRAPQ
jgi:hypothetical protein